jgi:hypothetical protein
MSIFMQPFFLEFEQRKMPGNNKNRRGNSRIRCLFD